MEYIGKCLYLRNNGKGKNEGENRGILVIGDLHLGYEESLNKSGVLVTRQMFDEMIDYLDSVFVELKKREKEDGKERRVSGVVLLGDVKHGFGKSGRQEWKDVLELFDYFINKMKEVGSENEGKIVIVKGNHDNYIANIAGKRNVRVLESYVVGEIGFCHGNKKVDDFDGKDIKKVIMGHGHPAVRLRDEKSGKEESYKCFLEGKWRKRMGNVKEVVIVPSFLDFSVGSNILREGGDLKMGWDFDLENFNVKIISGGESEKKLKVLDFGKLKRLRKLKL